jgi:hypothetical protein
LWSDLDAHWLANDESIRSNLHAEYYSLRRTKMAKSKSVIPVLAIAAGALWFLSKPKVIGGMPAPQPVTPKPSDTPATPPPIPSTPIPPKLRGDVDGNGYVTMMDYMHVNRMSKGMNNTDGQPYTAAQFSAADLDGDGQVTEADLAILVRIMQKLE